MKRIPVAGPSISQKEIDYVVDAVTHGWYEKSGTFERRFEHAFCRYLGVELAVSLPSCTSAIHLALAAHGIGPGDEIIVPDVTWIASAAPISYLGATPVFADVDPETWCLSASSLQQCITDRTRAVIVVDLYGGMPDMKAIRAIAEEAGILFIEDAAEAIGSRQGGKLAGAWGDVGVFSFHGSKTLTTGEGGMLVTNNRELYERAIMLRDHGRKPGDQLFYNEEIGYKYKMSCLQAALGLAQLERIDELVSRKREIFSWYQEDLGAVEWLTLNAEPAGTFNSYWMTTMVLDPELKRDKLWVKEKLGGNAIDCRPFFHPLSSLPAYRHHPQATQAKARNETSYAISPYGVNLPSALSITRDQVTFVADVVRDLVN